MLGWTPFVVVVVVASDSIVSLMVVGEKYYFSLFESEFMVIYAPGYLALRRKKARAKATSLLFDADVAVCLTVPSIDHRSPFRRRGTLHFVNLPEKN